MRASDTRKIRNRDTVTYALRNSSRNRAVPAEKNSEVTRKDRVPCHEKGRAVDTGNDPIKQNHREGRHRDYGEIFGGKAPVGGGWGADRQLDFVRIVVQAAAQHGRQADENQFHI